MSREIVYEETLPGVMTPKLSRSEIRAAEKKRAERAETIKAWFLGFVLALAFVIYVASNFVMSVYL